MTKPKNFDPAIEKRFDRAKQDMRFDRDMELERIALDKKVRETEKAKRRTSLRNTVLGVGAVGLTATVTALGLGHTTLGEGVRSHFDDHGTYPTSPYQNEKMSKEYEEQTGEPLITDQR